MPKKIADRSVARRSTTRSTTRSTPTRTAQHVDASLGHSDQSERSTAIGKFAKPAFGADVARGFPDLKGSPKQMRAPKSKVNAHPESNNSKTPQPPSKRKPGKPKDQINGEQPRNVEVKAEADIQIKVSPTSTARTTKRKRAQITEAEEENEEASTPSRKRQKAKAKTLKEDVDIESTPTKKQKKTKVKEAAEEGDETPKKAQRKRKTKEEKQAEAMPLAARTLGLKMYIGAHVSSAKGVQNAVTNCVHIGGNGFALFLKSQRKWQNPALSPEHAAQFKVNCKEHSYDATSHIIPHGSYLVNLAQKDPEKATQAYDCFLEDLQRCETLGIRLYNFHPGSSGPHPRAEAIARIAKALNKAHRSTKTVKTVLENMAGRGNVIGATFEDLRDIIALVDDESRVGVCLDTCHAFAAGYDLRTLSAFRSTLTSFDEVVGLRYLSALHINDSKAPFRSYRDLHQNIGLGFLGLRAFWNVVNEQRFEGLPLVLETPIDRDGKEDKGVWAREIKLLESLIGMDNQSEEFLTLEKRLADEGAAERTKHQEAFERKVEKDKKAAAKAAKGGRRKKGGASDESEDGAVGGGESDSNNSD